MGSATLCYRGSKNITSLLATYVLRCNIPHHRPVKPYDTRSYKLAVALLAVVVLLIDMLTALQPVLARPTEPRFRFTISQYSVGNKKCRTLLREAVKYSYYP